MPDSESDQSDKPSAADVASAIGIYVLIVLGIAFAHLVADVLGIIGPVWWRILGTLLCSTVLAMLLMSIVGLVCLIRRFFR